MARNSLPNLAWLSSSDEHTALTQTRSHHANSKMLVLTEDLSVFLR